MRTYGKETLKAEINKAEQNMNTFYQQAFLNWTGATSDTNELYSEVTASYLLEHLELLEQISCVGRESYHVDHTASPDAEEYNGSRKEEYLAQALKGKTLDGLGEIKEYQVPLKKSMSDEGVGDIDVVSLSGDTLYVIELKINEETLLRCAMEAVTYCRQADQNRLMEEYGGKKVIPAVLVCRGGTQEIELQKKPAKLTQLLDTLGIKVFFLTKNGKGEYFCERAEY